MKCMEDTSNNATTKPSRKWLRIRTGAGRVTGHIQGFRTGSGHYFTIPDPSRFINRPMDSDRINSLAMDQAILADQNETPMDPEEAAQVNAASLHTEQEHRRFKHDFARHVRNIAEGNPFL
jgi:hypothetical protein